MTPRFPVSLSASLFLLSLAAGCGGAADLAALHVLPGAPAEAGEDFFALPFPSDLRLKQGTFDLSRLPAATGQPGRYAKFLDRKIAGAGTSSAVYFRFTAPLDKASLPQHPGESLAPDASVFLVDVTPGSPTYAKRVPVRVDFHAEAGNFIGANWLTLRPIPGLALRQDTTYAALVTDRVRGEAGEDCAPSESLLSLLETSPPGGEGARSAWPMYAPLRVYLAQHPVPERIVSATVFTTQKVTDIMTDLRQVVYDRAKAPEPKDLTYLRDHDGLTHVYTGTFESPNFQQGTPPYLTSGGAMQIDEQGKPKIDHTETLRFALAVPNATPPAEGWPVVLYAHGTGGDYLTFVREGLDLRASFVELPGGGPPERMAMISIDQVLHGPRDPQRGDPELTFFNLQNLEAARDNVKQGAADDFQLLRLVERMRVDAAPHTGRPIRFNPKRIYFMGHSQGGLTGPLFVAAEPKVQAAVFSGAGSVLVLSLLHKRAPADVAALVEALLMEPATEDHPLLNLLQAYFESADPNNYGPLILQRPPAGVPPKHVFQTLGIEDRYTPVPNIAAFSLALGVQPIAPRLYNIEGLELAGGSWGRGRVEKNLMGGTVTGVLKQYTAPPDDDGHFVIFDLWAARHAWSWFLASHSRTGVATLFE
jgi:predicted esterase